MLCMAAASAPRSMLASARVSALACGLGCRRLDTLFLSVSRKEPERIAKKWCCKHMLRLAVATSSLVCLPGSKCPTQHCSLSGFRPDISPHLQGSTPLSAGSLDRGTCRIVEPVASMLMHPVPVVPRFQQMQCSTRRTPAQPSTKFL